jgi:hypothetical protein
MTTQAQEELDLLENFLTIDIFEDINSYFLHGRMLIVDNGDIISRHALCGYEQLDMSFTPMGDDEEQIDLIFRVYGIEETQTAKNASTFSKTYLLSFCSEEKILNDITCFSKKYDDKADAIITSIYSDIFQSTKEIIAKTPSENVIVYAMNNKPFDVIMLASRMSKFEGVDATGKTYSDLIMYEAFDGIHFDSLSRMMTMEPLDYYKLSFKIGDQTSLTTIREFSMNSYYDILRSADRGILGSTLYKFDPLLYKVSKVEKTNIEAFENNTTLGKKLVINESIAVSSNHIGRTFYDPELEQSRHVSLFGQDTFSMSVRLNGSSQRWLGTVINVDYPAMKQDPENPNDPYFEGNWLITAIRHSILRDGTYTQDARLHKNAAFGSDSLNSSSLPDSTGNINP